MRNVYASTAKRRVLLILLAASLAVNFALGSLAKKNAKNIADLNLKVVELDAENTDLKTENQEKEDKINYLKIILYHESIGR